MTIAKLDSSGDYILNGSKIRLGQIRLGKVRLGQVRLGKVR